MVDVLLFTDLAQLAFGRAAGAYRIATELRNHGYTVQVVDHFTWLIRDDLLKLEAIIEKFVGPNTLFIGFSSTFFNLEHDLKLIDSQKSMPGKNNLEFGRVDGVPLSDESMLHIKTLAKSKNPKIKLVVGGTKAVHKHGIHIDIFVEGYGDTAVIKLAKWLQGSNPFFQYKNLGDGRILVNDDPKASQFDFKQSNITWHESDLIEPQEVLPMEVARGCIFSCKFCAFPLNGKKRLDFIKSEDVLYAEFMRNYEMFGVTKYVFADDTYNDSLDKLEILANVYNRLPFKIGYSTYLRHDLMYAHPEMITLLKESGLQAATFGVETLNWKAGKAIGKGLHPEKTKEILQRAKDEWGPNVSTYSGFIIGLPHETPETVAEWAEEILDCKYPIDSVRFVPLAIFPNSPATFKSEFELNYQKYGYKFDDPSDKFNWSNDAFTYNQANKLAYDIYLHARHTGRLRTGSFFSMMLLNCGVPWEDIRTYSELHLIQKYNRINMRQRMSDMYYEKLMKVSNGSV